jgi:hypothetical protein
MEPQITEKRLSTNTSTILFAIHPIHNIVGYTESSRVLEKVSAALGCSLIAAQIPPLYNGNTSKTRLAKYASALLSDEHLATCGEKYQNRVGVGFGDSQAATIATIELQKPGTFTHIAYCGPYIRLAVRPLRELTWRENTKVVLANIVLGLDASFSSYRSTDGNPSGGHLAVYPSHYYGTANSGQYFDTENPTQMAEHIREIVEISS